MNNTIIIEEIGKLCPPGIYETGYASLKGLLHPDFSSFPFGISIARKLDDSIIDKIKDGPTIAYHDLYHAVNLELNEKVTMIAEFINSQGINCLPVKATLPDSAIDESYAQTLRYKISHKMVATRSGMGWIGKTDLLITKRFGPRVRLASILTTEPVSSPGIPIEESLCGSCDLCVKKCPASASKGVLWSKDIDRDEFYDAHKCRNYCKTISDRLLGKDISICGICVSICPKGRV